LNGLDQLMAPRVAAALAGGKLSPAEFAAISDELLASSDMDALHGALLRLAGKLP
jgi:hypothetical protein